MRIPTLEAPAPDEMFTAWIAYIAKLNHMSANEFYRVYFRICKQRNMDDFMEYPANLEYLCQMERDSTIFPKLETILKQHTDLYAMLPFMTKGMQAKFFEFCLRSPDRIGNISGMKFLKYKPQVCPICMQNDLKNYKRIVLHVPHQLVGVHACWKHGLKLCRLSESDDMIMEDANEIERYIAIFMHELYRNPCFVDYERVRDCMEQTLREKGLSFRSAYLLAVQDGYFENTDIGLLRKEYSVGFLFKRELLPRFLVWLYENPVLFRQKMEKGIWVEEQLEDTEEFICFEKHEVLSVYQCRECSGMFYMHPEGVNIGLPCPYCARDMTEDELYHRYIQHYEDGEYEFTDTKRTHIRHKPCGGVIQAKPYLQFWVHGECQICQSSIENWQQKVDASKERYRVLKIVREKDRLPYAVTEHVGHGHTFCVTRNHLQRKVICCTECEKEVWGQKRYLGMKRVNKEGEMMEIVAYRKRNDFDVQFSDGTIVKSTNYKFENGVLKNQK